MVKKRAKKQKKAEKNAELKISSNNGFDKSFVTLYHWQIQRRWALSEFIIHEILYCWIKSVAAKCILGVSVCNKTCMLWNNFIFDCYYNPHMAVYAGRYTKTPIDSLCHFILKLLKSRELFVIWKKKPSKQSKVKQIVDWESGKRDKKNNIGTNWKW